MTRSRLQKRFLIVAGPHMGKSSILDQFAEEEEGCRRADFATVTSLHEPFPEDVFPEDVFPDIAGATCLLVDNLHARPKWISGLLELAGDRRIVATSEKRLPDVVAAGFRMLELNPWGAGLAEGRRNHREAWEQAWTETREALGAGAGDLPESWIDGMYLLTSGHPVLVEIAYELTALSYDSYLQDGRTHAAACDALEHEVPFMRSQLTGLADSVADSLVRWLADADADGSILSILARGDREPRGLTIEQEGLLRMAGLVHGSADYPGWTAPDILRPLIVRRVAEGRRSSRPKVELTTVPSRDMEGTIEVYPGTEHHAQVHLRGRGWQVFQTLFEADGEVVQMERLRELFPGDASPQVVRSAVQRISDRLRERSLPRLIENHHGVGYAFLPPPSPAESARG